MKRTMILGVVVVALFAAAFAYAAPLNVTALQTAAGGDDICACDPDVYAGIQGKYVNCDGFCVDYIEVWGIKAECVKPPDSKINVVLTEKCDGDTCGDDEPGKKLYETGKKVITGTYMTFSVPGCVKVEDVDDIHILMQVHP